MSTNIASMKPERGARHGADGLPALRYVVPAGRALFAAIFLTAGLTHFSSTPIDYATQMGLPFAWLMVPLSGVIALAATVSSAGSTDTWHDAGVVGVGCLLVALVALLVGTGFGLLIRNPVLACAATVVVPLGLWLLLGVGVVKPAQAWLTPFPSVQHLLSGDMSGLAWPQWTVMALLWGGGLNALGAARLRRSW